MKNRDKFLATGSEVNQIPASQFITSKEARQQLEHLYSVFGRVVFLVLDYAKKEFKTRDWEQITFEQTQTPAYQQSLIDALARGGNLAVRLGPLSDGLRAIDVDIKTRIEEFRCLNPMLRDTLTVYGNKGCQFFFRLAAGTEFPHKNDAVHKIKTVDGQEWGEWRYGENGGAYSMIFGQHDKNPKVFFRLEGSTAKEGLIFDQFNWPEDLRFSWLSSNGENVEVVSTSIAPELARRIEAYLDHCSPSIAGHGGDMQLFRVACKIANGFALTEEQTYEMLARYFNPRCQPPWDESRLRYKASEAQKVEHDQPRGHFLECEPGYPPIEKRPCFRVYDRVWNDGERLHRAGTYYHEARKMGKKPDAEIKLFDVWICAPLEVLAITATREDKDYARLVQFTSQNGRQKCYAIPERCFAGQKEEPLAELLNQGLSIAYKQRALVAEYVANERPQLRIGATFATGWYDSETFVLPEAVIGNTKVWYQSDSSLSAYAQAGTLESWQGEIAARAVGNSNLIVALCVALAGPLLHKFNVPGSGLHLFGETTTGKTSILEAAQSVWGGPSYRRSWRATTDGLEGAAMLHTDTVLIVDEIHLVDPRELDSAIYALINGCGKSRADQRGGARSANRWRVMVLSSGEVSSEVQLAQAGLVVRAGQTLRFLDIPAEGKHGAFTSLHGHQDGAVFADTLRDSANQHYGYAGPRFVKLLLGNKENLSARLAELQSKFDPANDMQRRAARIFAILALAGELATKWELVPWPEGTAIKATGLLFKRWQRHIAASAGTSPQKKILAAVARFIDLHGDSRFSALHGDGEEKGVVRDRAGYWLDEDLPVEGELPIDPAMAARQRRSRRIYLFTATGLREVTTGYDRRHVLSALDQAGAFTRKDEKQTAVVCDTPKGKQRLYHIDPAKLE
jgi:putative DNA primase/helicase